MALKLPKCPSSRRYKEATAWLEMNFVTEMGQSLLPFKPKYSHHPKIQPESLLKGNYTQSERINNGIDRLKGRSVG